jgi:hypothetical protein
MRGWSYSSTILDLDSSWRRVVSFTAALDPPPRAGLDVMEDPTEEEHPVSQSQ